MDSYRKIGSTVRSNIPKLDLRQLDDLRRNEPIESGRFILGFIGFQK